MATATPAADDHLNPYVWRIALGIAFARATDMEHIAIDSGAVTEALS